MQIDAHINVSNQLNKKKDKKRKRNDDSKKAPKEPLSNDPKKKISTDVIQKKHSQQQKISATSTAVQEARHAVQSAVQSNPILSNLFGGNKKTTEKERRDALFTRNC
jgi:hypothetical protein